MQLGLIAAFVAGVLSISSPCVLPLLPFYLAHLAGAESTRAGSAPDRRRVLVHAVAFVLGFGLIFVLLGVSLGALGGVFLAYRDWIVRIGGIFMIVMGLHLIGLIHLRVLDASYRVAVPDARARPGRLSSSFLVGVGFAAGWTPCVGPVLGAIFTLAVSAADPIGSGSLFAAYAAGLAVPFLGIALALGGVAPWIKRAGASVNVVSGALLTAIGVLMVLGMYQQLFARIVSVAPWTPLEPQF